MPEYTPEDFAKELIKTVRKVPRETTRVVRRNAVDVKRQWRRNVRQTAPVHHARAFRDINFDVEAVGVAVEAEIGYDTGPGMAGNLGNLLEFGGGGDHSPPHRDGGRALDGQEALFADDVAKMGQALLEDAAERAYLRGLPPGDKE